ncbi:neutral zinc metallopeptidase, partial [Klebsiella pneumoniae]|uniref:neutral zinc metallopeptidase n=1 Tax=Klebsiella pneumoniae TaxID=573 RepID=UPI00195457CA
TEANHLSVRVELMADCLAGVWAKNSNDRWNAIDQSAVQEAIKAAEAIGDDKLQQPAWSTWVSYRSFQLGRSAIFSLPSFYTCPV